jgi:hypothetical protein
MHGGLVRLQFGNQFLGSVNKRLVQNPFLDPAVTFDRLVDLVALFTPGSPPGSGGSQPGHLFEPSTDLWRIRSG